MRVRSVVIRNYFSYSNPKNVVIHKSCHKSFTDAHKLKQIKVNEETAYEIGSSGVNRKLRMLIGNFDPTAIVLTGKTVAYFVATQLKKPNHVHIVALPMKYIRSCYNVAINVVIVEVWKLRVDFSTAATYLPRKLFIILNVISNLSSIIYPINWEFLVGS